MATLDIVIEHQLFLGLIVIEPLLTFSKAWLYFLNGYKGLIDFLCHSDDLCWFDVHDSLSLPDARAGPPLTIVMNNPEVPKIHGAHNLQTDLFFYFNIYSCGQGQGLNLT